MSDWQENWKLFLAKKYGNDIPEVIILDLGEVDFYLPAIHATNAESFRALKRHNEKISIF